MKKEELIKMFECLIEKHEANYEKELNAHYESTNAAAKERHYNMAKFYDGKVAAFEYALDCVRQLEV